MKINIIPIGSEKNSFMLKVKPFYTGLVLKKKIEYRYGVSLDTQILIYKSTRVNDNTLLSEYDVQKGDSIHLLDQCEKGSSEYFRICCKTLTGAIEYFYVHPDNTISDLKEMVQTRMGSPVFQQRLIYLGIDLREDGKAISDYNILPAAIINVVLRLAAS